LLTQFPDQLPPSLPGGVRQFDYVPFSVVLPRCAALIHHGGIGTTAQAIAAGAPQLVVPTTHDQPDNAVRIRRLGLGDFILPRDYTKASVMEKLDRLTTPAVKGTCQRWAASGTADAHNSAPTPIISRFPTVICGMPYPLVLQSPYRARDPIVELVAQFGSDFFLFAATSLDAVKNPLILPLLALASGILASHVLLFELPSLALALAAAALLGLVSTRYARRLTIPCCLFAASVIGAMLEAAHRPGILL
jgi:hypothetical protein